MRIYQCIHKYGPHIPAFERRWGIDDNSTFAEIHDALLRDGYAAVYRLIPPSDRADDGVFFTVWNYERLQHTWAREHGLATTDLDEIRLAQIAEFQPDIVFDFSYFVSPGFAEKLKSQAGPPAICWYAFVKNTPPPTVAAYAGYLTLHRPYVDYWRSAGLAASELQPAIDPSWHDVQHVPYNQRADDLIFYGQISRGLYGDRQKIIRIAAEQARRSNFNFSCFAQCRFEYRRPGGFLSRLGIDIPLLRLWPDDGIASYLRAPIYGASVYEAIRNSRITLNTFGDYNGKFLSNMRIFEVIGNGSVLLSPRGSYPEGLVEGVDFLGFDTAEEMGEQLRTALTDVSKLEEFSLSARKRVSERFSKRRQYDEFSEFVSQL